MNKKLDINSILNTMFNTSIREHKYILNCILAQFEFLTDKTLNPKNMKLVASSTTDKTPIVFENNSDSCDPFPKLAAELKSMQYENVNSIFETQSLHTLELGSNQKRQGSTFGFYFFTRPILQNQT
jgi:hypothetical protein